MGYATYTDANAWLDGTKISFANQADADVEGDNADKIIRGRLSVAYGDELDDWSTTEAVPQLVNEIAAMLMAAYRYQKVYSQTAEVPVYGDKLEARAMDFLEKLANGEMQLSEKTYESGTWDATAFLPNDTDPLDEHGDPDRKFTMSMEL